MSGSFPFTAEGERASQLKAMVLISSNHNSSSTCLDWHAPQRRAESNTTFHLFRWPSRATPCSCTVHKRRVGWSLAWSHPIADLLLDRNHHQCIPQLVSIRRWRPPTPSRLTLVPPLALDAASLLKRQLTFDVPEIKNVSMDLEDGSRINWGETCDGGRRLRAIQHGASSGLDASALVPVPEIRKQRQEQTSILL